MKANIIQLNDQPNLVYFVSQYPTSDNMIYLRHIQYVSLSSLEANSQRKELEDIRIEQNAESDRQYQGLTHEERRGAPQGGVPQGGLTHEDITEDIFTITITTEKPKPYTLNVGYGLAGRPIDSIPQDILDTIGF